MIKISAQLLCQFTTFISHKGISSREQSYYVKWVRFYLDFCHKYNFNMEADKHTVMGSWGQVLNYKILLSCQKYQ